MSTARQFVCKTWTVDCCIKTGVETSVANFETFSIYLPTFGDLLSKASGDKSSDFFQRWRLAGVLQTHTHRIQTANESHMRLATILPALASRSKYNLFNVSSLSHWNKSQHLTSRSVSHLLTHQAMAWCLWWTLLQLVNAEQNCLLGCIHTPSCDWEVCSPVRMQVMQTTGSPSVQEIGRASCRERV